mgnify:CR=1 FL=1
MSKAEPKLVKEELVKIYPPKVARKRAKHILVYVLLRSDHILTYNLTYIYYDLRVHGIQTSIVLFLS